MARILAPFQGAVSHYVALTRGCARFTRLTPGYSPSRLRRGRIGGLSYFPPRTDTPSDVVGSITAMTSEI